MDEHTNKFGIEFGEPYLSLKHLHENGLACQYDESPEYDGRTITINHRRLLHLANCSYLGLEKHPALVQGTVDAVKRYGTQFPMSRAILSSPLFKELEVYLSKIFPGYPIVYASTTVAHYSALPLLAKEKDALILDAYVHNSVRVATQVCKANGTFVMLTRHNDMAYLHYMVQRLKKEGYRHIWYCADGIYSMHGDVCDVKGLQEVLDQEDRFYAYVDDAHGIGCCGKHGCGYVMGNFGLHDKMIVAGSLSKSIPVYGGFLAVPDPTLADYLKLTGHTFIFSNPIPPPVLGALVESMKLHLTDEVARYQRELSALIAYFNEKSRALSLPILSYDETPIRLVRIGDTEKNIRAQQKLVEKGYFSTTATYPSISEQEQGIRVSLTRHISREDIGHFLEDVKEVLTEEQVI